MKKINGFILAALTYLVMATSSVQAVFDKDDTSTDYFKVTVDSWFDIGDTLDPLTFTDFLVCIANAAGVGNDSLVNAKYKANGDSAKCETGESSSTPELVSMTIASSKLDNAVGTPQNADIWYNGGPGNIEEPEPEHFIVQYQQTVGVNVADPDNRTVDDIPFGAFTMSWQHATVDAMRGTLSYVNDSETNKTTYKLYVTDVWEETRTMWIHGSVSNDLSAGEAHVGIDGVSHSIKYTSVDDKFIVYRQKGVDAAVCEDESLGVDRYVYEYNLYDEDTGAFKSLNGPFSGSYENPSLGTKRIHAGPWGIWFEDQAAADRYSVTSITHEDGTVYTGIIFEPHDDGNDVDGNDCTASGCIAHDGIQVVIPGATAFDQPIIFPYAKQSGPVQTLMALNSSLNYFGKNSLYGLPWYCLVGSTWTENVDGSCETATDYRPQGEIANFTTLTDSNDVLYKAKAVKLETKMKVDAGATACTSNNLTDLASVKTLYAPLTADNDVTAVTTTWADRLAAGLVDAPLKVEVGRDDCLDANGQSCAGLNGILVTE